MPFVSASYLRPRQTAFPSCALLCPGSQDLHGCASTDNACLCNNPQYIASTAQCIQKACTNPNDVQAAFAAADALCRAVGVDLNTQTVPLSSSTTVSSSTPTTTSTGTTATSGTASSPSPSSKTGPIIGGAVAGVVVIAAVIFIIWKLQRRRRPSSQVDLLHGDLNVSQGNNHQNRTTTTNTPMSFGPKPQPVMWPPALTYATTPDQTSDQTPFNPYSQLPSSSRTQLPATAGKSTALTPNSQPKKGSKALPSAPSSSSLRSASRPSMSLNEELPITTDQSNRLSVAQLQTIQSLVERNVKASTLEAIVDSMVAAGPSGPSQPLENRGSRRSPAPPAYDASSSAQ